MHIYFIFFLITTFLQLQIRNIMDIYPNYREIPKFQLSGIENDGTSENNITGLPFSLQF